MAGVEFTGIEGGDTDVASTGPESLYAFADRVKLNPQSKEALRAFTGELVRRQGYIAEELGVTREVLHVGLEQPQIPTNVHLGAE